MYAAALHEIVVAAEKALARVRQLRARYPADVTEDAVAQLERVRSDPRERRRVVRLGGGDAVTVRTGPAARPAETAPVLDRSPGGLAVRLGRPLAAGDVLGVGVPGVMGQPEWFLAQVRHCRPAGDGWAIGCEYLGEGPLG
jgi:hypothetical protein